MISQAHCASCGEEIDEANLEAFELTGQLLCEDCADAYFEDEGQTEIEP